MLLLGFSFISSLNNSHTDHWSSCCGFHLGWWRRLTHTLTQKPPFRWKWFSFCGVFQLVFFTNTIRTVTPQHSSDAYVNMARHTSVNSLFSLSFSIYLGPKEETTTLGFSNSMAVATSLPSSSGAGSVTEAPSTSTGVSATKSPGIFHIPYPPVPTISDSQSGRYDWPISNTEVPPSDATAAAASAVSSSSFLPQA